MRTYLVHFSDGTHEQAAASTPTLAVLVASQARKWARAFGQRISTLVVRVEMAVRR